MKPEVGMRVRVLSPDRKKNMGFGTIEKVESLIIEETGEVITATYPSRIVLDSGDVTEGAYCWWTPTERQACCPYCQSMNIEEIHKEGYGYEYTCQTCYKSFDEKKVQYKSEDEREERKKNENRRRNHRIY